jgi:hypothetical protein
MHLKQAVLNIFTRYPTEVCLQDKEDPHQYQVDQVSRNSSDICSEYRDRQVGI